MNQIKEYLSSNGFVEHDHVSHFGSVLPGVYYCFRQNGKNWEYFSVIEYLGTFCEAVHEVYMTKKTSYRPKGNDDKGKNDQYSRYQKLGFTMIDGGIYRNLEEIKQKVK